MAGQYKRVYITAGGIASLVALLLILQSAGLVINDLSGDIKCAGTIDDPCISYFNIKNPTAKSVYIYNKEGITLDFNPDIKEYQLYVKYYGKWVPMDFTMETRLPNVPEDRLYTFVFPRYSTKEFKLEGYKNNPTDVIKWGVGNEMAYLDPIWNSVNQITYFGKRAKVSDGNYTIIWKLDDQGISVSDGKIHLFGELELPFDKDLDFAIITPEPIKSGNFFVEYDVNQTTVFSNEYTCPTIKFGWVTFNEKIWCNITVYDLENSTQYDYTNYVDVTSDNYINASARSIYWNTTQINIINQRIDLASKFNHASKNTSYGDEIYYVKDLNAKQGIKYDFEIVLDIEEKYLPLKYTIAIGNIETNTLWFVYDPTITTTRTWTTTADFTNDTLRYNVTTVDNEIKLGVE